MPAPGGLTAWTPDEWPMASDWRPLWDAFLLSPDGRRLADSISERLRQGACIYPPTPLRALELTPLAKVRVVVLGQDPYHGPGQAEGLAFSVPFGQRIPPSLRNIHEELARECGRRPDSGSLLGWADQGVLLLNTTLTVEEGSPASHAGLGWESFTDQVIRQCAQSGRPKAFLLWGAHAQSKARWLTDERHRVLKANHPSPLSARRPPAPFIGCGHFGAVNQWLAARGEKTIDWFAAPKKFMA